MATVTAYATPSAKAPFEKVQIERREVGPKDVLIKIAFAGICHSDIHTGRNEWGEAHFPLVPGHEIAGTVEQVGSEVTKYSVGDHVGVGCMVDSCRECENCKAGEEQYCLKGNVGTYNAQDYHKDNAWTDGGYSTHIVVDEDFVLRIPDSIPLDQAAPLLCAGITLYSPLHHWNAGPGKKVAIVGMGGLGHMGVKIAHAMGAEVTVLSQSLSKQDDGKAFGADHYYATKDDDTFDTACRDVRPDREHRVGAPADGEVPQPAQAQRHAGQRRRAGRAARGARLRAHPVPPQLGRLDDRRHPRDAGDARLLRRAQHRLHRRGHQRRADQRGLGPRRRQRRALPLRDRHQHVLRPPVEDRTGLHSLRSEVLVRSSIRTRFARARAA